MVYRLARYAFSQAKAQVIHLGSSVKQTRAYRHIGVGSVYISLQGRYYSHGPEYSHQPSSSSSSGQKWEWKPIPVALGVAFLGGFQIYRIQRRRRRKEENGTNEEDDSSSDELETRSSTAIDAEPGTSTLPREKVRPHGPWQVKVLSTLPLKAISRLWGRFNELDLPYYLRVPGFKLYSWIFGVNLDEVGEEDLHVYPNLSSFFYRTLKPGCRPLDPNPNALLSPADGKIIQFGVIRHGEVEQVKGMTYRVDALLGSSDSPEDAHLLSLSRTPSSDDSSTDGAVVMDDEEFARMNDISYTLPELISGSGVNAGSSSSSLADLSITPNASSEAQVQSELVDNTIRSQLSSLFKLNPNPTATDLHFCVIYLAPGDYHRFHSPTSWVVERRRHFAGELYSVSPYLVRLLPGLFTLNERVALLGRWKWGFFSLTPVGATNVGSIRINFDKELRTNSLVSDTAASRAAQAAALENRPFPGFVEASYKKASPVLKGYPLQRGEEMGGFRLGSTVVLVFETPAGREGGTGADGQQSSAYPSWEWAVKKNQKVKVGEALGYVL